MAVLVTCKNEEDPIKNEGARVATRLYVDFIDGGIWPKFELIRAFKHALVTCKMKKIKKINALEWPQHFSHCEYMGIFLKRSKTANSTVHDRIWPNFERIRDLVTFTITCINEDDRIKSESARVATIFSPL